MVEEISLEETNRIRIGLGLKPIPTVAVKPTKSLPNDPISVKKSKFNKTSKSERKVQINDQGSLNKDKSKSKESSKLDSVDDTDSWLSSLLVSKNSSNSPTSNENTNNRDENIIHETNDNDNVQKQDAQDDIKISEQLIGKISVDDDIILTLKDKENFLSDSESDDDKFNHKNDELVNNNDNEYTTNLHEDSKEKKINNYEDEEYINEQFQQYQKQLDQINNTNNMKNKKLYYDEIDLQFDKDERPNDIQSLDYLKSKNSRSVTFKKNKKKIKKNKKSKSMTLSLMGNNESDHTGVKNKNFVHIDLINDDDGIVDDGELQQLLSLQRKKKNLLNAKLSKSKNSNDNDYDHNNNNIFISSSNSHGLVIDETSDFLSSMKSSKIALDTKDLKNEEDEYKTPIVRNSKRKFQKLDKNKNEKLMKQKLRKINENHFTNTINNDNESNSQFDGEPNFSLSLADTIKFLDNKSNSNQSSNLYSLSENDDNSINTNYKKQMALKNNLKLLKLNDEIKSRKIKQELKSNKNFNKLSLKQKEQILSQKNKEIFYNNQKLIEKSLKDYNPVVELKYFDDNGKLLTTKQAYKHLSRTFHGNGADK
ncbi:U4/U6-U5 snRNP complex subunit SNU66 ASCRUDRAFT_131320 [Ascoidea rubescens DSM 1968]|uniref:Uncharacterized protein n=1 Tax=Ascoidea rubescens DSM 1968 TaxID=1344418 RepID=A0A1D2V8H5_9ASCO|nr:hypothetical protein ASCRUDRAFT_131320 [Ascoidea rubescens DSM 1968]ODV57930.1 hypothetical protein ASCRUDRAFT_131320 [Ascoidea rubescens DSM 1968]